MSQTLLDRLSTLDATIQALKADPGPSPSSSRIIIKELQKEAEQLKAMANASSELFRALHDVVGASNQADRFLWKQALLSAQSAIALVQKRAA